MKVQHGLQLVRQMGPLWAARRAWYSAQKKLGHFERLTPACPYPDFSPTRLGLQSAQDLLDRLRATWRTRFFIGPDSLAQVVPQLAKLGQPDTARALADKAQELRQGRLTSSGSQAACLGWPPKWHGDCAADSPLVHLHWSRLEDLGQADIKQLWEPARFASTYTAVRAYWLTGDAGHAETFWQLVESWLADNPPNQGVNWVCGQECAIRLMAWVFGLFTLLHAPATTATRAARLLIALEQHGQRIESNLNYAWLQKNNHGINEALGLWTLGQAFPELPRARAWANRGRALVEREVVRQFATDGGYVQHSLSYHRFVLQSLAWARQLAKTAGQPMPAAVAARHWAGAQALIDWTDETTGQAPNYGSNDGAQLFRLDACDVADYRPTLQLSAAVLERPLPYDVGPWSEPIVWLTGTAPLESNRRPAHSKQVFWPASGYVCLRQPQTTIFSRASTFEDRPAQADQLHVDLFWKGHSLLADPGTYSYNSPAPWKNGLAATRVHNTLSVDGQSQMQRGPRFTWLRWSQGTHARPPMELAPGIWCWEANHDGFLRGQGIVHHRAVLLIEDALVLICDDLRGTGEHIWTSQWLFPGSELQKDGPRDPSNACGPSAYAIRSPVGDCHLAAAAVSLLGDCGQPRLPDCQLEPVTTKEDDTLGWYSPQYLTKIPSSALFFQCQATLPARTVVCLALGQVIESLTVDSTGVQVTLPEHALQCAWTQPAQRARRNACLIKHVAWNQKSTHQLSTGRPQVAPRPFHTVPVGPSE